MMICLRICKLKASNNIKYHLKCYRDFTDKASKTETIATDTAELDPLSTAFNTLVLEVESDIFIYGKVGWLC